MPTEAMCTLRCAGEDEWADAEDILNGASKMDRQGELVNMFGSRKSRKIMKTRKESRCMSGYVLCIHIVDIEAVDFDKEVEVLPVTGDDADVPSKLQHKVDMNQNLPPYDLGAPLPSMAYPLSLLLTEQEWTALAVQIRKMKNENEQMEECPVCRHATSSLQEYVSNRLALYTTAAASVSGGQVDSWNAETKKVCVISSA